MNLRDTPQQAAVRDNVRTWLADNVPTYAEPEHFPERFHFIMGWQRKLARAGFGALSWPVEYGGRGLGPDAEAILAEELGRAGAPTGSPLAYLGRPLETFGTPAQRERYLPNLLAVEEVWCQGFSEPEAGSDLAALRTRARLVGDTWHIDGQKVWTSYGAYADLCLLLVRTSDEPRHRGLSALIVPMNTPGITVRPIAMSNGVEEFAEVFFDDVKVPADALVGNEGEGWAIAQSTIAYERGAVDIGYQAKFSRFLDELAELAHSRGIAHDPCVQHALGRAAVGLAALRLHCLRSLSTRMHGTVPGPRASIDKLLMTEVEQTLLNVAMDIAGPAAMIPGNEWWTRYLFARAGSIYGGTAQIQRTILAGRVLGLERS